MRFELKIMSTESDIFLKFRLFLGVEVYGNTIILFFFFFFNFCSLYLHAEGMKDTEI